MKKVLAIFVSDLHLSHTPPIWRSCEEDWYALQERALKELQELRARHSFDYGDVRRCPIFCAGDIFNSWSSPPELINFALEHLPKMYAIPGQHDLPNHNIKEMHKSAYWTLVKAGKVMHIDDLVSVEKGMLLHGFSFGRKVRKVKTPEKNWKSKHIALIHQYNWVPKASYKKASTKGKVTRKRKEFKDYDIVVCGDNHIPFEKMIGDTLFWNCGGFMRRHSDEIKHRPRVGLLMEDGTMKSHRLKSYHDDKYISVDPKSDKQADMDLTELGNELLKLNDARFDFTVAVNRYMQKYNVRREVMEIVMKSIGVAS